MHFPLFVDLEGKKVLVVGGGKIACRRIAVLRRFGAAVTVVAPAYGGAEGVTWMQRDYRPGDLEGAFLAVAATDNREVNRLVGREAARLGIPVSVADRREECSFFFPAVCLGDGVVAGLTSDGTNHARTARAARIVRRALEELE